MCSGKLKHPSPYRPSVYSKSIKLGQMTTLNVIFMMWRCQFIDSLKFETPPSSLCIFGLAYNYPLHF